MKKKPRYRCAECGGENVHHAMWVDLNTEEIGDVFGSWCAGDNSFCTDCDSETEIEFPEEPEESEEP